MYEEPSFLTMCTTTKSAARALVFVPSGSELVAHALFYQSCFVGCLCFSKLKVRAERQRVLDFTTFQRQMLRIYNIQINNYGPRTLIFSTEYSVHWQIKHFIY